MATESQTIETPAATRRPVGWWAGDASLLTKGLRGVEDALLRVCEPAFVVEFDGEPAATCAGIASVGPESEPDATAYALLGLTAPLPPAQLGDHGFREKHGLRFAYIAGAMANGIASERMVEAMARAGMVGFFGAAGLDPARVEAAIDRLQASIGDLPHGFNLIHSPSEPWLEEAIVDLYLRREVRLVSAAAYINLTPALIRYRTAGIYRDADGNVVTPNRVIAKVSRVEVARRFFSPPPEAMLRELVERGAITSEQAELATQIPVAEDLTAEADSGGHTDNRPALALLPTMLALRDEMQTRFGYAERLRVGLAGGIATPAAAAAAFAMGAAYVLTGTINQACVESGSSNAVRAMLAEASQADVVMAPAADMFEMGVNVQVLKRGTMFAIRAKKLYEFYRVYNSLDEIPAAQRATLERDFFRAPFNEVWRRTREFFATRDPSRIERAERDPKHKMALVFRSYLGQASRWANEGEPTRQVDYQVWCGPAMGAFNEWTRGSFLEKPERRDVVTVAMNLLIGAAALTRAGWLRTQGVPLSPACESFTPRTLDELAELVQPSRQCSGVSA